MRIFSISVLNTNLDDKDPIPHNINPELEYDLRSYEQEKHIDFYPVVSDELILK